MATRKILSTNNYGLFTESGDNRPVDLNRHRALEASMREYKFLPCYPLVCRRENGKLVIRDGQHRFAIAASLGLMVYYVEEDAEYDNAKVNGTPKPWLPKDYALTFAAQGKKDYVTLIEFADSHGLPCATAAMMLAGSASFNNIKARFDGGEFTITDRAFADRCAVTYTQVAALSGALKTVRFLGAVMSVCRVEGFDPQRLIANAKRCREKLVGYSTADAFLLMIEEVYNHSSKRPVPLRIEAMKISRQRNPATRNKPAE